MAETPRPFVALGFLAGLLSLAMGLAIDGQRRTPEDENTRERNRTLVLELGLTDFSLWSEATYCRHPTQTDHFAAWADHPGALEHFPAGSLVPPPRTDAFAPSGARIKP